jgi:hypothetical protein
MKLEMLTLTVRQIQFKMMLEVSLDTLNLAERLFPCAGETEMGSFFVKEKWREGPAPTVCPNPQVNIWQF